jgi:hypothetical protein
MINFEKEKKFIPEIKLQMTVLDELLHKYTEDLNILKCSGLSGYIINEKRKYKSDFY